MTKNRNTNPNLLPVPMTRALSPPPSRNKNSQIQNSSSRYGSRSSNSNISRSPPRPTTSNRTRSPGPGPSKSGGGVWVRSSNTNRIGSASSSNTTRSDFPNRSNTDHMPRPSNTSTGGLPNTSYSNIRGLSSSLYTNTIGLSNPSYTDVDFPGSSHASSILSGSSSTSVLQGDSYTSRNVFPSPSTYNRTVANEPAMINKPLNIDEFGNMDSDNEDDTAYSLLNQVQKSKTVDDDSVDGVPISSPPYRGQISKSVVDDSIDGVPISDSMIHSRLPSNMNFERPGGYQSRSSAEINFRKDSQSALQDFIQGLKDPESFRNKSKDNFMQTPISSLVRDKYMLLSNNYVGPASSDHDEFNPFDTMEQGSSSMKGRRPDDYASNLSSDERRRTDHSTIHSMIQPDLDHRGLLEMQNTDMTGSSVHHGPGDSDRRTDVSHSRQESRCKNRPRENQKKESRSDDGYRRRKSPRESSRSSKGSKKDEIKSVKLSWHLAPVDRRKGESEEQERDKQVKNPLLKGFKQASKIGLGKARQERNRPSASEIFQSPSDMEEDNDEEGSAATSNIIVDNERNIPTSMPNQSFMQNTMGMPSNAAIPQEQGFMQNTNGGLQGNLMVPPDQGFILNNMGLPGNYALHPEQRFLQSTGIGLSSNLLSSDQHFIQNTNMGLSGMHPSALQSIQEALRQQEALMMQNSVMHQSALHTPQQSMQPLINERPSDIGLQNPTMHNMLQPPLNSMSQQSLQTQRTMSRPVAQNLHHPASQNVSSMINQNKPFSSIQPPSFTQNKRSISRFSPGINNMPHSVTQNKASTATNLAPPIILNPSVPPPATPFMAAHDDVTKGTAITPSVNEVMMKLAPDGTGSVKYPAPDTNLLTFDPDIGYRYDDRTGLHYDANSGYFFNSKLKVFLYWDLFTQTYLRVENPTIPFPILRNKKESSGDQQNVDTAGTIINMKKLIEQHRQIKLEQDKTNQDVFSRSRKFSRSGSRDRENRRNRSRKRRASPGQSDWQKKRQRGSLSPRRPTLTRRVSRSPRNARRSNSPISGKPQRKDDKCSLSPASRRRLASPGSSTRMRNDHRRSESPDNKRRPPPRSPKRPSHSRSPARVTKRRSVSPKRRDERRRSGSADNKRRPIPRSPLRRRSQSKSPPVTKPLPRRKDNRNRSKSPINNRRHPVSRSPLRRRSRSLSPSKVSKRRSPSPGSLTRKREERRKRSKTPDKKPRVPENVTTQPSLKVTVLNPLARIESKSVDKRKSNDTPSNDTPTKKTLDDYVKMYSDWGDESTEEVHSISVPLESKLDEQISPHKSSLDHKNIEEVGVSGMKPQSSTASNVLVTENKHKAPSSENLNTGKSNDGCGDTVSDKNESLTKGNAIASRCDKKSSGDGSTSKNKEKPDVRDGTETLDKQSTEKLDVSKKESESASRRRPRAPLEGLDVKCKDGRGTTGKPNDEKSKSMRRSSYHDKQKNDEKQITTRNDSRSSGKRYASHKDKDTKSMDTKFERRGRENTSRNIKPAKQKEESPTNEGRNHRLVSERQFSGSGNKFSFPRDEISHSKPRPSSQFDPFLSVKPIEDDAQLESVMSGIPDDLSEFVVLDGIEDDEDDRLEGEEDDRPGGEDVEEDDRLEGSGNNADMTEEDLQLLLADDNESKNNDDESKSKVECIISGDSCLDKVPSASTKDSPTLPHSQDNENHGEITALKVTTELLSTRTDVKSSLQLMSSYSQPPSPASSIYSSYNFSDDENFVTVSAVVDEAEMTNSAVQDEEVAVSVVQDEEESKSVTNSCDGETEGQALEQMTFKEQECAEESLNVCSTKVGGLTKDSDLTLQSSENFNSKKIEKQLEVSCSESVSSPSIIISNAPIPEDEVVGGVIKSSIDGQTVQTKEESDLKQQEVEPDKEVTSVKIESSLKVVCGPDGTSQLDGSEVLISEPVKDDLAPGLKEIGQDKGTTPSGTKKGVKEGATSPEDTVLELLNEEQNRCSISSEPVKEEKYPSKGEPVKEEKYPNKGEPVKEEKYPNKGEPVKDGKDPNKREPVKEEKCPKKGEPVGGSDKEANVPQGKKVSGVFSRLGGTSKDSDIDNRVPGDTDPMSKLYGNTPTRFVHLKTSVEGRPWEIRVIRESLNEHLFTNKIMYTKASVNTKNNLGCPFEFLQVTFESAAQAEQWFKKTGRKITLQSTKDLKVDYYMYYAQPSWRCKYCDRVFNIFFRSMCYVCYCHKSGSFTNVRFTDEPTKYVGVIKIPATVNESNVLQHLHATFRGRNLKSVRIVEDPEMKFCCGLVVVELPSISVATAVHRWSLKKNPNQIVRYIEVIDASSDSTMPKVVLRDAILKKPKSEARSSRVRPKQRNIQVIDAVEERSSLRPRRPIKDNVRSRDQEDRNLSPIDSIFDEIGVPPDFEDYGGSNHSYDSLEVSHRLVEYDPGQDRREQELIDLRLGPQQYERSVSPRRFDDYGMNPLEREFSPNRGSGSRGSGDVRYLSRGRDRSRGLRSLSPRGDPHPSSRRVSPPRRRSPQRHRSPLRRLSPHRYHSPPLIMSPERYLSPPRRPISPQRRHSPPRHFSPPRRHSPHRSPPRRRHSPPRRSIPPLMSLPRPSLPVPNGMDSQWIYPPPDTSKFEFESNSGLYYDPETTLYYDTQTRLFYNGDLNIYLEYDRINSGYVRVG